MKTFNIGAIVRVSAIFADSAGTSVDPTTVKFSYRSDALAITTTLTISKDSVGHYHSDINTQESAGHYDWRFFGITTNTAATIGEFYVSPATAI